MMDIKVDLLKLYVDLFNKNTSGRGIQSKNISNKPIIRKLKKRKVHSSCTENIWGADLANMQLVSKFNKGI